SLRSRDHAVAPFVGHRQRDDVMHRLLVQGLRNGDKCICVAESDRPRAIMERAGLDVDDCVASRRLDLLRSAAAYCPDGQFHVRDTLDRWSALFDEALAGSPSFDRIRAAAEVSATVRDSAGLDTLFRYELAYDRAFGGYPLQSLCLY